jgi:hypothetical protein
VLLETGRSLSALVKLPNADEPVMLSVAYKAQHGGPPQNFAAFQREAQIQKHMQDKRGRAVRDRYPCFEVRPATTGEILNDSYQGLGAQRAVANPRLPRRAIIDPDRRSPHGLLSWTRAHGGYACHELLLPDLKRALRR